MPGLKIFSGSSNRALAEGVCDCLRVPLGQALIGTFKNGETRIRIEEHVRGADVFVIQSTSNPTDHHIMELLIMIDALRRASANRVTAVIPYYGYAKQEKKTAGREPISAKLVANLITTAGANRVVGLDLHAPAIQGFFDIPMDSLTAVPFLADLLVKEGIEDVVVVSPDAGGVARATDFRYRINADIAVILKRRPEPDKAEVLEMVGDVYGKCAVIVDDMISTGGTLEEAARVLHDRGARSVYAYAVHPVFAGDAIELIENSAYLERVVVTNTIPVPAGLGNSKIRVENISWLLAEAIQRIHEGRSISAMFETTRFQQELLV